MKENAIDFVKYITENYSFKYNNYFRNDTPLVQPIPLEKIYDQWLKRTI